MSIRTSVERSMETRARCTRCNTRIVEAVVHWAFLIGCDTRDLRDDAIALWPMNHRQVGAIGTGPSERRCPATVVTARAWAGERERP